MDLASVADELYSLRPEDFVSTRNAREKEAKAAGDTELAARIRALTKPNATAWLANQLAREYPDELRPLLELGESMREATANLSGDQLRELGKQRHQLVNALVQRAKLLATGAGRRVGDDAVRGLENTLHAALADRWAAEELLSGRLTEALSRSGFETGGSKPDLRLVPKPAGVDQARSHRGRAAEAERAERDEQRSRAAAEDAAASLARARTEAKDAERAVRTAIAAAERLQHELDRATSVRSGAEREQRRARAELERAERVARDADTRLTDATARRAALPVQ